jgi:hypothetical protein
MLSLKMIFCGGKYPKDRERKEHIEITIYPGDDNILKWF